MRQQKKPSPCEETAGTVPAGHVAVTPMDSDFACCIRTEHHWLVADEPAAAGGTDLGPNPYEYLLAALGACTSMTLRMYARRKGIELADVKISLSHRRIHASDCEQCESTEGFVDQIEKRISLTGKLTKEQKQRLLEIAERCPIHKTLTNEILITSVLD
jgi:uncharacterized OsmC-like protein